MHLYSARKISKFNIPALKKVSDILYECGKDMAAKYDLRHWDNSHVKNWLIVAMCALKHDIYLIYRDDIPVATFQTRKIGQSFRFQKLATSPKYAGGGDRKLLRK